MNKPARLSFSLRQHTPNLFSPLVSFFIEATRKGPFWKNVFERGKALKHTTRFPLVAYIVEYSCCQYDRYLALPKIRSSLP